MTTLRRYCVHSTLVPVVVPFCFPPHDWEIHMKELLLSNGRVLDGKRGKRGTRLAKIPHPEVCGVFVILAIRGISGGIKAPPYHLPRILPHSSLPSHWFFSACFPPSHFSFFSQPFSHWPLSFSPLFSHFSPCFFLAFTFVLSPLDALRRESTGASPGYPVRLRNRGYSGAHAQPEADGAGFGYPD